MIVVINSECSEIPEVAKPLVSEGNALLNLLISLEYDPLDPPFAALLSQYHRLEGDWLVLSPSHWQASHNNAVIVGFGKDLELTESESRFWFQSYFDYFGSDDVELYYHDADTWLLSVTNKPLLKAKPVHHMINQPLMKELTNLDSTMHWQKFFTESQMFFASQPNSSLLNGLWLWGGAKLAPKSLIPICVDEAFLSLAEICSSNVSPYNDSVSLKTFKILFLNDISVLSKKHKNELNELSVQWYWNNSAYSTSSLNWVTRFWRALTHAH